MIVVTSDHGEMLGDHGYFRKCEPYEGSANIPFIIAASPGLGFKAGARNFQPVCLEDIMPTLLALAGEQPPPGMDGVSLVPALAGEKAEIRRLAAFRARPLLQQGPGVPRPDRRPLQVHLAAADRQRTVVRPRRRPEGRARSGARRGPPRALLEAFRTKLVARLAKRPGRIFRRHETDFRPALSGAECGRETVECAHDRALAIQRIPTKRSCFISDATARHASVSGSFTLAWLAARSVFPSHAEADVIDGDGDRVGAELVFGLEQSAGEQVQVEVRHQEIAQARRRR